MERQDKALIRGLDELSTPPPPTSPQGVNGTNPPIPHQGGNSGSDGAGSAPEGASGAGYTPLQKLGTWFMCAVVFAVLPPIAQLVQETSLKNHQAPGFFEFCARADLYIVCMGLAA